MKALRHARRRYQRRQLVPTDWERFFELCPAARSTEALLLSIGFVRRGRVGRVRLRDGSVSLLAVWMRPGKSRHDTFTMRIKVAGHG